MNTLLLAFVCLTASGCLAAGMVLAANDTPDIHDVFEEDA